MSDYYDTGDHDVATDPDSYGHDSHGSEHEHDERLYGLAEYEAAQHDVHYQHGHHVEYDAPGVHYEESDYTSYSEHDARVESLESREHSFYENVEHWDEAQPGHELPFGHDMPELPESYPHHDGAPVVRN